MNVIANDSIHNDYFTECKRMNSIKRIPIKVLGIAAASLGLCATATAQFPGDVFFAQPSQTVIAGQTVEMEVQTFAGDKALGAIAFNVRYDASQVTVEMVNPGADPAFVNTIVSRELSGMTGIATLNDQALDSPFGTVSVAKLVVRPLVPPGESVQLQIEVVAMLDGQSVAFPTSDGLSATITVTSASESPTQPIQTIEPPVGYGWYQLGVLGEPRRLGHVLDAMRAIWIGGAFVPIHYRLRTIDPSQPADWR